MLELIELKYGGGYYDKEKRKKQKFIFRLDWLCACGGRECSRSWKYLEISVSGGEGWRRTLPFAVPDSCIDVWIYSADNGDCDWEKNEAKSADSIWTN
jgi:hypothetical protein